MDCGPTPPKVIFYRNRLWDAGFARCIDNEMQEFVSVIGTNAFMEFVESIQAEGVVLERQAMGVDDHAFQTRFMIEVDKEND